MRLLYLTAMIDLRGTKMSDDRMLEAKTLLNLINTEFQNNPISVRCFDFGLVERVKKYVEDYEGDNETHLGDRTGWLANDGMDCRTKAFV